MDIIDKILYEIEEENRNKEYYDIVKILSMIINIIIIIFIILAIYLFYKYLKRKIKDGNKR